MKIITVLHDSVSVGLAEYNVHSYTTYMHKIDCVKIKSDPSKKFFEA